MPIERICIHGLITSSLCLAAAAVGRKRLLHFHVFAYVASHVACWKIVECFLDQIQVAFCDQLVGVCVMIKMHLCFCYVSCR